MEKILKSKNINFSNYSEIVKTLDMSIIELFEYSTYSILRTEINEAFSVEKFIMQCNKKILLYPDGEDDGLYI